MMSRYMHAALLMNTEVGDGGSNAGASAGNSSGPDLSKLTDNERTALKERETAINDAHATKPHTKSDVLGGGDGKTKDAEPVFKAVAVPENPARRFEEVRARALDESFGDPAAGVTVGSNRPREQSRRMDMIDAARAELAKLENAFTEDDMNKASDIYITLGSAVNELGNFVRRR